jgi:hypothetical protein
MWCGCTSVIILSCAQRHPRPVMRKHRRTAKGPLQFSPGSPIAAVLSEGRAYRSAVSVVEDDIADQRSSKLAAGSLFASTVRPLNIVVPEATMPSVQGEWDLMVTAVAATTSRATATNPVIVRCFVTRTSYCGPKPLSVGHGNFAKVQQQSDKYGLRESADGQRSCPKF